MFELFRNFFGLGKTGAACNDPPQLPNTSSTWIPKEENDFGIDVLDCRAFCQSMTSTCGDLRIAATFAQLRSSAGEQYGGKSPENAESAECSLEYPYDGNHTDGALFKAQTMEDKWDIYLYDNKIYFTRSWTGDLIYVADVRFDSDFVCLTSVTADAERSGDSTYAIGSVDYLLKSHIYRCLVPHPIPNAHPNDADQITFFSFGEFGRFAGLASFGDTARIRIPEPSPNKNGAFNGEVDVVITIGDGTEREGSADNIDFSKCVTCTGSGKCFCIRKGPGNPVGCPRCGGSGECRHCKGTGSRA